MEQVTIEGILDRPLLQLVKDAPANRMTRGQVRAATNLVLPDVVNTSEGIIEYVLENYDKDKAPAREITSQERAEARAQRRRDEERMADRDALVIVESEASEVRLYDTTEMYRASYQARIRFQTSDFEGCGTKAEVISVMEEKAQDHMFEEGISDEDHVDTCDSEFREAHDFEHVTDYEEIWDRHKVVIAEILGTTPEEME